MAVTTVGTPEIAGLIAPEAIGPILEDVAPAREVIAPALEVGAPRKAEVGARVSASAAALPTYLLMKMIFLKKNLVLLHYKHGQLEFREGWHQ